MRFKRETIHEVSGLLYDRWIGSERISDFIEQQAACSIQMRNDMVQHADDQARRFLFIVLFGMLKKSSHLLEIALAIAKVKDELCPPSRILLGRKLRVVACAVEHILQELLD
jgi:hypothetical protein